MINLGRLEGSVPRSKRLLTDETSNVLVYMTGKDCTQLSRISTLLIDYGQTQDMVEKDSLNFRTMKKYQVPS